MFGDSFQRIYLNDFSMMHKRKDFHPKKMKEESSVKNVLNSRQTASAQKLTLFIYSNSSFHHRGFWPSNGSLEKDPPAPGRRSLLPESLFWQIEENNLESVKK